MEHGFVVVKLLEPVIKKGKSKSHLLTKECRLFGFLLAFFMVYSLHYGPFGVDYVRRKDSPLGEGLKKVE